MPRIRLSKRKRLANCMSDVCRFSDDFSDLGEIDWSCHNSDGKGQCDCLNWDYLNSGYPPPRTKCGFYGRPVEPLAFDLDCSQLNPQTQSPLYRVATEIRFNIWEYALADNVVLLPNSDNVSQWIHLTDADLANSDSAIPLLHTCKVVYLETYRLPMMLNGKDRSSRSKLLRCLVYQLESRLCIDGKNDVRQRVLLAAGPSADSTSELIFTML